jgi:hypothetical protein
MKSKYGSTELTPKFQLEGFLDILTLLSAFLPPVTENTGSESPCQGSGAPLPLLIYTTLPAHQFTAHQSVKTAFLLRETTTSTCLSLPSLLICRSRNLAQ